MSPVRVGVVLALVISGPPLYGLVQGSQLSTSAAFGRGGVVAAILVVGAVLVLRLIENYSAQIREEDKAKAREEALKRVADARAVARGKAEEAAEGK